MSEPDVEVLDLGALIDIRKFALEQAVNALPNLRNGAITLDVASKFEDYILNGWAKHE